MNDEAIKMPGVMSSLRAQSSERLKEPQVVNQLIILDGAVIQLEDLLKSLEIKLQPVLNMNNLPKTSDNEKDGEKMVEVANLIMVKRKRIQNVNSALLNLIENLEI